MANLACVLPQKLQKNKTFGDVVLRLTGCHQRQLDHLLGNSQHEGIEATNSVGVLSAPSIKASSPHQSLPVPLRGTVPDPQKARFRGFARRVHMRGEKFVPRDWRCCQSNRNSSPIGGVRPYRE